MKTTKKNFSERAIIETARKYGVNPGSMKCHAFALFDQGFNREEVRYLLRSYRKPEDPGAFSGTLRTYHKLWGQMQHSEDR